MLLLLVVVVQRAGGIKLFNGDSPLVIIITGNGCVYVLGGTHISDPSSPLFCYVCLLVQVHPTLVRFVLPGRKVVKFLLTNLIWLSVAKRHTTFCFLLITPFYHITCCMGKADAFEMLI